jgi:hypothetical protein
MLRRNIRPIESRPRSLFTSERQSRAETRRRADSFELRSAVVAKRIADLGDEIDFGRTRIDYLIRLLHVRLPRDDEEQHGCNDDKADHRVDDKTDADERLAQIKADCTMATSVVVIAIPQVAALVISHLGERSLSRV